MPAGLDDRYTDFGKGKQMPSNRPGYKTYKNRKKTLRQRLMSGWISQEEHDILRQEAADAYRAVGGFAELDNAKAIAEAWLDANAPTAGDCDITCVTATGPDCECPCEGHNHGAANGMRLSEVRVRTGRIRSVR